jgi:hypothetical protein
MSRWILGIQATCRSEWNTPHQKLCNESASKDKRERNNVDHIKVLERTTFLWLHRSYSYEL